MSKPEIVVVTGASAGLGRAIVRAFAQEGAHVGLIARGREGLEGARREVEELGGKAVMYRADVADAAQVEAAAAAIEEQLGPIDIWVNNAMTSVFSPIKEMTAAEFKRVTDVTDLLKVDRISDVLTLPAAMGAVQLPVVDESPCGFLDGLSDAVGAYPTPTPAPA